MESDFFEKFADSSGVPVVDKENWQMVVNHYGKDVVKKALASYIENQKPSFPYRNIPIEKVKGRFRKLCKTSMEKMLITKSVNVLEKFEY